MKKIKKQSSSKLKEIITIGDYDSDAVEKLLGDSGGAVHIKKQWGDFDEKYDVERQVIVDLAKKFEDSSTLWVLSPHWRGDKHIEELFKNAMQDRVVYYGHPNNQGTNRYQHLGRVVLTPYILFDEVVEFSVDGEEFRYLNNKEKRERDAYVAMHMVRPVISKKDIIWALEWDMPRSYDRWRRPDITL